MFEDDDDDVKKPEWPQVGDFVKLKLGKSFRSRAFWSRRNQPKGSLVRVTKVEPHVNDHGHVESWLFRAIGKGCWGDFPIDSWEFTRPHPLELLAAEG